MDEERPLLGMIRVVREFEGGPQPMFYECQGHVNRYDFVIELEDEYELTADIEDVLYRYARNVPVGRDRPGQMTMMVQSAPQRGAYPITFLDASCVSRMDKESE